MMPKKILALAITVTLMALASCSKSSSASPGPVSSMPAQEVLNWNEIAYEAFGGTQYQHSLMASRINAMVQLAIHDALNGIEEKYSRYAFTGRDDKADPIAAAAAAAHTVLVNEIPAQKQYLDSVYASALLQVAEGEAKERGMSLGKNAGLAVLAKRLNDGAAADPIVPVAPSETPGVYQTVPPFIFQFAPFWENVKTFSLQKKDQFRCLPLPALNSAAYANAFNEVKDFGKKNSTARSEDQTAFAKFWYEFSEAGWNRVARIAIINKNLNMLEAARLLALVDMAIADAYIAGWDSKIHYNFWRPYTAIRMADKDGNNQTAVDLNWEPSEPTPPIHDYPSTHSALGSAAAKVLAMVLGDQTSFTMTSPTAFPVGASRSFVSFSEAARENADSRVMAGIHFRFSCDAGLKLGEDIGAWTVANHLKALE